MTKYLEDKRASLILIVICFITYTIIGLTRNAYGAAIVGIIKEGYFTKSDAGIIATSFNITYCLSQIVGSYFVDKVSPFKIILLGAVVTIFANIAMSINPTYWTIFIARGVCGVAQFGIWPALLRILSEYVNKDHRHAWRYVLPLGITVGSVLSYLSAAVIPDWRGLFTLSYILMAVATVVFFITAQYAEKKAITVEKEIKTVEKTEAKNTESISVWKLLVTSGALFFVIPIFMRGLISGGIGSWMPTMIMESYNVSPAISSVMTTISTCANLASVVWVIILYPRVFKLQSTATGAMFLLMVPFLGITIFIGQIPMLLTVILITITNTFNGSLHQFNTVEIPGAYSKFNKAGMIAGLINAVVTSAGIVSGWLWGMMAETYSWNVIVTMWTAMALVSALCCFGATPLWKKFVNK